MSSEISPFDNANVLTFMHNTSEMGIEIDSFCFKKAVLFQNKVTIATYSPELLELLT